jgi:hypothetical protein
MFIPKQWSVGFVAGVFVLLGTQGQTAQAQPLPGTGALPMNPYLNPAAASSLFNAASLGRALSSPQAAGVATYLNLAGGLQAQGLMHTAAYMRTPAGMGMLSSGMGFNGGYGWGMRGMGGWGARGMGGAGALGYGSLMSGGYGTGMGYGLMGGALSGAAMGYGNGLGMVQWMMNPYQGYLQGAADITRSQADYWTTISQARLVRQETIRSSLETRRAMIEELEWERSRMPDPEKLRQQELERELNHARISPPLTDIWSARALNSLLRHLINQQSEGVKGPRVPLSDDVVKRINVTAGNTRGNVGLLKDNGNLDWPESLQGEMFKEPRERINALMKRAYQSVTSGNNPSDATLADLVVIFHKLQAILNANVKELSPDLYIEASRYLGNVKDTITALQDPNVVNQFNSNWAIKAGNVAQMVDFMREKGLRFAPATQKDEAAYVALYHALASFDAALPRVASASRGNVENADNK